MLSISKNAVAISAQAKMAVLPAQPSNWVLGVRRMNFVSVSDLKNKRLSGNFLPRMELIFAVSCEVKTVALS